ncbi:hypothetical protein GFL03_21870 [Pseudomonas stutzeri]|uniref:ASCH domain-containing protein n=1 Tax=Stutzerimonas frequens TaxID=2968969 RepID=UPI00190C1BB7|nr:ASCH domain-containing protein [Stutzerimonas frequens]MBK3919923.1 hypothetical protein [Stutzerimonas frequens]
MKALSIRQPWAWLIVRPDLVSPESREAAAGQLKDVENRSRRTNIRGRVLVHASLGMTRKEYDFARDYAAERGVNIPAFESLPRGGTVGSVEIVDCLDWSDSKWYMGQKAYILRDAVPLPFVPMKGQLGFFECASERL